MAKRNHLTAGNYSGEHAFAGTAQKNEDHTRHRLFQGFQESICRLSAQKIDAIEYIHLALCANGGKRDIGNDFPDLLNKIALSAFGGIIVHIGMVATQHAGTVVAFTAAILFAQDGLSEGICRRCFVGAGWASKQVSMAYATRSYRRTKKLAHARLAEHSVEDISHRATHLS